MTMWSMVMDSVEGKALLSTLLEAYDADANTMRLEGALKFAAR